MQKKEFPLHFKVRKMLLDKSKHKFFNEIVDEWAYIAAEKVNEELKSNKDIDKGINTDPIGFLNDLIAAVISGIITAASNQNEILQSIADALKTTYTNPGGIEYDIIISQINHTGMESFEIIGHDMEVYKYPEIDGE